MLKTPLVDLANFPDVYDPREDSFLFIDALEKDFTFLKNLKPQLIVEIGSGSGLVIATLPQIFDRKPLYFATDINIKACQATITTAKLNNFSINCVNANLLDCFKEKFDLILFNPPYVVTGDEEITGEGLSRAWAGGKNGRRVICEFLGNLHKYLSENGCCYMVLLKENGLDFTRETVQKFGFRMEIVVERKIPGEYLFVTKFHK